MTHRSVQDPHDIIVIFYDYYHVEACRVFRESEFVLAAGNPSL